MTTWLVKAGTQGVVADKFLAKKKIAVSWFDVGDFPIEGDWPTFRSEVKKRLPAEYSEQKVGAAAGQLWAFARVMQPGDYVISPITYLREVYVGRIIGDYKFDATFDVDYQRTREVEWFNPVPWDSISDDLRKTFTAWQTILKPVRDFSGVIAASQDPNQKVTVPPVAQISGIEIPSIPTENLAASAAESIREMLKKMHFDNFQRMVGAVFQAAGFTELYNSAGRGADGGIDIILSKDPLGAGERIVVQVKHTADAVTQPDLQKLLGTLKPNEHGLMVSLNGVNSNSDKFWRDNRDRLLRPMEAADVIQMLQENYEKLKDEHKTLIPLKRIYVPFKSDDEG